jgi:glycosyltransferase involved in cell wall biosynthesis
LWRALTEKEAGQIRACGIRQPVVVVPNGVNVDDYAKPSNVATSIETPMVPQLSKDVHRVLFLGRVHPKKGLDVLLLAWSKLTAMMQGWQLVIAGPDEQGHLARIQNLSHSLGLANSVVFTGPVTGHAKLQLLYSCDLFILPSYSEGFSMSILEAMACGRPVIATDACNFPDLAASGAGWECAPTAEALEASLKLAMKASDSERNERGSIGRQVVETRYTWATVIDRLEAACAIHC